MTSTFSFEYRPVTPSELERLWEKSIQKHPDDSRWVRWRKNALSGHADGTMQTFAVIASGEPVGEGTLLLSPLCPAIGGRTQLADGALSVNVNGLRIEKAFEGQGHISKLIHSMEEYARGRQFSVITIGVEACEIRNRSIYYHWGYQRLIHSEFEDSETVLYYAKDL